MLTRRSVFVVRTMNFQNLGMCFPRIYRCWIVTIDRSTSRKHVQHANAREWSNTRTISSGWLTHSPLPTTHRPHGMATIAFRSDQLRPAPIASRRRGDRPPRSQISQRARVAPSDQECSLRMSIFKENSLTAPTTPLPPSDCTVWLIRTLYLHPEM